MICMWYVRARKKVRRVCRFLFHFISVLFVVFFSYFIFHNVRAFCVESFSICETYHLNGSVSIYLLCLQKHLQVQLLFFFFSLKNCSFILAFFFLVWLALKFWFPFKKLQCFSSSLSSYESTHTHYYTKPMKKNRELQNMYLHKSLVTHCFGVKSL